MSINYRRRLPADISIQADADEYIRPTEVVDADEQSLIDMIRNAVVGDTRRQPKGSGKDDPAFHEPHWGHTTGLLQGTLAVDRIEALPERFRVGLFATARSYPVVCRPNLIHDRKAGFAASRMALKLK